MRWAPVDKTLIHQIWPEVEKHIESAFTTGLDFPEWSALYNEDHVRLYLANGEWQLLVACDENNNIHGALVVSYINYPLHRVAFVVALGGKGVFNKELFAQIKTIFRYNGATMIQAYGRKSVQRMLRMHNVETRLPLLETLL